MSSLQLFLRTLFSSYPPNLYMEIRALQHDGEAYGRRFLPITPWGFDGAESFAESVPLPYGVCFGVLPRIRHGGCLEDVTLAGYIWADLDKGTGPFLHAFLCQKLPIPHLLVESGGGRHLYWRLSEVLDLHKKGAREQFTQLLKRLALLIDGDRAVTNVNALLRLPGTLNPKYDPPRLVNLVSDPSDAPPHSYAWWDAFLPPLPEPPAKTPKALFPDADTSRFWLEASVPLPVGGRFRALCNFVYKLHCHGVPRDVAESMAQMKATASGYDAGPILRNVRETYRRNPHPTSLCVPRKGR